MFAERTDFKVLDAVIGTDAISMVNGKQCGRVKKSKGNNAMYRTWGVFPILAQNTARIADAVHPVAQDATVQSAAIYSGTRQASYTSKGAGLVNTFISRYGFPCFIGHDGFSFGI